VAEAAVLEAEVEEAAGVAVAVVAEEVEVEEVVAAVAEEVEAEGAEAGRHPEQRPVRRRGRVRSCCSESEAPAAEDRSCCWA
jgi:hypothetical protein